MVQSQTELLTSNDGGGKSDLLPAREEKTGRKASDTGSSREGGLHSKVLRDPRKIDRELKYICLPPHKGLFIIIFKKLNVE